jgi:uncharacterized protein (DUF1778 family)
VHTDDQVIARRIRRIKSGSNRDRTVGARITRDEESELVSAADRAGRNISDWSRDVLLREARGSRTDVLLTEIVAMRMMLNSLLRPLSCGETITPDDFTAHMMTIRTTKQKVTQEILQQYAVTTAEER